jgi:DNA anti-recombination protein RmuC
MQRQHPDNFLLTSRQFTTKSATRNVRIVPILQLSQVIFLHTLRQCMRKSATRNVSFVIMQHQQQLSKNFQKVFKVVKKMSKSCQKVVKTFKKLSKNFQKVVKVVKKMSKIANLEVEDETCGRRRRRRR